MKDKTGNIKEVVQAAVNSFGFILDDMEYITQGRRWILRIYIDKEGGITLDDCAMASREIGRILDSEDVISNTYMLEVSSPGLDRPLKTINDYFRYKGRLAKINTKIPYTCGTSFKGRIVSVEGEKIIVETEKEGVIDILFSDVANAKLVVEF